MSIDFVYECPNCKEKFCGEIDDDKIELHKKVDCENCLYPIQLDVKIDLTVSTK